MEPTYIVNQLGQDHATVQGKIINARLYLADTLKTTVMPRKCKSLLLLDNEDKTH